jgi:hypothetical protein
MVRRVRFPLLVLASTGVLLFPGTAGWKFPASDARAVAGAKLDGQGAGIAAIDSGLTTSRGEHMGNGSEESC